MLATLLAACGSSAGSAPTDRGYDPSRAKVPVCAHAGKAIKRPTDMPADIPVPLGTSLTSSVLLHGARVMKGYVPTSSFTKTVAFFQKELPRAGYATVDQAAEGTDDFEATFRSKTYAGHWKLHRLDNCNAALLQLAVQKLKIASP